eukprot:gene20522-24633_t
MTLISTLLVLAIVGLVKKNRRFSSHDPKGPIEFPIIGSLHRLGKNPHKALAELGDKHGGIAKLYLGDYYTVVLNDPKLIKQIWVKHFDSFSNRPHTPTLDILSSGFNNITIADHAIWRVNREKISHLFTKTKLKTLGNKIIEKNSSLLINKMKEFQVRKEPFQPELYFKKYAFGVILNMAFTTEIPYDEEVGKGILGELVSPIQEVITIAGAGNIWDYFHHLAPLYLAYKKNNNQAMESIIVLAEDEIITACANMLMNFKLTSSTGKPLDESERF